MSPPNSLGKTAAVLVLLGLLMAACSNDQAVEGSAITTVEVTTTTSEVETTTTGEGPPVERSPAPVWGRGNTLYPMLRADPEDPTRDCWYYTEEVTRYRILTLYGTGDADLVWLADPANPEGPYMVAAEGMQRCP